MAWSLSGLATLWMAVIRPWASKSKVTGGGDHPVRGAEHHARAAVDLDELGAHVGGLDALIALPSIARC
jgi:hypothetical protein